MRVVITARFSAEVPADVKLEDISLFVRRVDLEGKHGRLLVTSEDLSFSYETISVERE